MKSQRLQKSAILAFGIAVSVAVLVLSFPAHDRGASFRGKSIETWTHELSLFPVPKYSSGPSIAPPSSGPRQAIRYFGADAVPYLLEVFDRHDSKAAKQIRLVLKEFGIVLPNRLARWIEPRAWDPSPALEGFSCLGIQAEIAVPHLAEYLSSGSRYHEAASALGLIGPPALPALLRGLANSDPKVRRQAAVGLQMLSPAADHVIVEFLKELDIECNPRNSWSNRSVFYLTASQRTQDWHQFLAYPELGTVIRNIPITQITNAVEKSLKTFDSEEVVASTEYQSTEAFYQLVEASEVLKNGIGPSAQMSAFFDKLAQAKIKYPDRIYSFEILRLQVLLAHERYDEADPVIGYLERNAGESWIKWRDLAFVLVERRPRERQIWESAIEAVEKALSLRNRIDSSLLVLARRVYGGAGVDSSRMEEIERLMKGTFTPHPFYASPLSNLVN